MKFLMTGREKCYFNRGDGMGRFNCNNHPSFFNTNNIIFLKGCCVRDRMVVGFTSPYAINAYHH
jgi:hypothetical protein